MIEVRIDGDIWRRKTKGQWERWNVDHWEINISPRDIIALETGFEYGRQFLRWQISQLRNE
jgi:hypothetical protein